MKTSDQTGGRGVACRAYLCCACGILRIDTGCSSSPIKKTHKSHFSQTSALSFSLKAGDKGRMLELTRGNRRKQRDRK